MAPRQALPALAVVDRIGEEDVLLLLVVGRRRAVQRGLTIVGELLDQRQCRGAAVAGGGRQGGGHLGELLAHLLDLHLQGLLPRRGGRSVQQAPLMEGHLRDGGQRQALLALPELHQAPLEPRPLRLRLLRLEAELQRLLLEPRLLGEHARVLEIQLGLLHLGRADAELQRLVLHGRQRALQVLVRRAHHGVGLEAAHDVTPEPLVHQRGVVLEVRQHRL
mmetsp:Transcript_9437/g.20675  ORF Transcript_9437/g.20675 Transcript_9437/m.20675 type:complete len:220 (+) Transcript_9437:329-988(+)